MLALLWCDLNNSKTLLISVLLVSVILFFVLCLGSFGDFNCFFFFFLGGGGLIHAPKYKLAREISERGDLSVFSLIF